MLNYLYTLKSRKNNYKTLPGFYSPVLRDQDQDTANIVMVSVTRVINFTVFIMYVIMFIIWLFNVSSRIKASDKLTPER